MGGRERVDDNVLLLDSQEDRCGGTAQASPAKAVRRSSSESVDMAALDGSAAGKPKPKARKRVISASDSDSESSASTAPQFTPLESPAKRQKRSPCAHTFTESPSHVNDGQWAYVCDGCSKKARYREKYQICTISSCDYALCKKCFAALGDKTPTQSPPMRATPKQASRAKKRQSPPTPPAQSDEAAAPAQDQPQAEPVKEDAKIEEKQQKSSKKKPSQKRKESPPKEDGKCNGKGKSKGRGKANEVEKEAVTPGSDASEAPAAEAPQQKQSNEAPAARTPAKRPLLGRTRPALSPNDLPKPSTGKYSRPTAGLRKPRLRCGLSKPPPRAE